MTPPNDLDNALTEWGREARAHADATSSRSPDISSLLGGLRTRARRGWAIAAAMLFIAALGTVIGLVSANQPSPHRPAAQRSSAPTVMVPCELDFGVSSVTLTPTTLTVRLSYQGSADCLLGSGPPGLLLVSAHGLSFGSREQLSRVGGYHPPRTSRTVRVHPGDTVSFRVSGFHDCLPTPSDSYTLRVALDSSAPPSIAGGVAVPIGHLEPSGLLCLTAGLGAASPLTVTSPRTVPKPTAHPTHTTSPPGVAGGRLWNSDLLVITGKSLGGVQIGMTSAAAARAAGVPAFVAVGDGVLQPSNYQPGANPVLYLGNFAGQPASSVGGSYSCVGANLTGTGQPHQVISTAQGLRLGDPVSRVRQVYGASATFMPLPSTGGIAPHAGYVLDQGNYDLVIKLDPTGTRVVGLAGGLAPMTPSECNG